MLNYLSFVDGLMWVLLAYNHIRGIITRDNM